MISNSNPWAGIPRASRGQFSRQRVDISANFALFWIRDEENKPGLLIEISKKISAANLKEIKMNIHDIAIDVMDITDEGIRAIIIKLKEEQNQDIFFKVCTDLIEHAVSVNDVESTFKLIYRRLRRWQVMLSNKLRKTLSRQEIQGLYTELYFIGETIQRHPDEETLVIHGWEGPEKNQHDFVLNDIAVEIKSVAGNQRSKVKISSEDQLDTHLRNLYLRVYLLAEIEHGNMGESLNAIVKRITNMIKEPNNRDMFELKLLENRYAEIDEYDTPLFVIYESFTYRVEDSFPRITRNQLSEGVENVSYDLVLASIEKFKINTEIIGE